MNEIKQDIPVHKFVEWGKKGGQKSAKKNSKRLKDFWKKQKTLKQAINNVEKVELST